RHVTLTSRRALPPRETWARLAEGHDDRRRVEAVRAIEALGGTVDVVAADVADAARMEDLFREFGRSRPPVAGVFHAAVDMSARTIPSLAAADVDAMMRAKVAGALVLDW